MALFTKRHTLELCREGFLFDPCLPLCCLSSIMHKCLSGETSFFQNFSVNCESILVAYEIWSLLVPALNLIPYSKERALKNSFVLRSCRSNKGRSDSDCLSEPKAKGNVPESSNFDLPERHKSLHMPLAPLPITKKLSATAKKAHLMMSDEVHDYSEIYTPSTEEAASKVAKDDALK